MKHLPKLIYVIGILFAALAIYKYWFVYSDMFKTALGCGIGLGILFVGYLYNWMQNKDLQIQDHENINQKRYDTIQNKLDSLIISLKDRDVIKYGDVKVK